MTVYYVDPVGSDVNNGLSVGTPWASIGKVNATILGAGDTVLLKRGGTWTGTTLTVSGAGTSTAPITVATYGVGPMPIIDGGGSNTARGTVDCVVLSGSWIVYDGIQTQHANINGVLITGANVEARNFVSRNNAVGLEHRGSVATIHDFQLVDNNLEVVGPGSNDDYGAVGLSLGGDLADVHHWTITGSLTVSGSPDYGSDGSAVEVFGATNTIVRDGVAAECETFTECGNVATANVAFRNIAYTSSFDHGFGINVHGTGAFGPVTGVTFTNVSIRLTGANAQGYIVDSGGQAALYNSIVQAPYLGYTPDAQDESNNVWFGGSNGNDVKSLHHVTQSGIAPTSTITDPLWVDPASGNLRLRSDSPAVDRGLPVAWPEDLDGLPRTVGAAPDAGAYEWQQTVVVSSLRFPDSGSRQVLYATGDFAAAATGIVYADAAGTVLAEIYADAAGSRGARITNAHIALDAYGRQPDFWGPLDGTSRLYITVGGGPLSPVDAGYGPRIDALAAQVGVAETPAGAQAKATAAQVAAMAASDPLGTAATAQASAATDATTKAATATATAINSTPMRPIVPLYAYPSFAGSDWDTLIAAPAGMVIANPASGPGLSANSDWTRAIGNARAAGIKVLGYVALDAGGGPGTRAQDLVTADIDSWDSFYPVDGYFLDIAPTGANGDKTVYFAAICAYGHAKAPGRIVVVNPGTHPLNDSYVAPADIVCTWEGDYTTYLTATVPSYAAGWYRTHPATKYAHLVYDVPDAAAMTAAATHAAALGARWLYGSQTTSSWTAIAAYWTQEVATLRATPVGYDPVDPAGVETPAGAQTKATAALSTAVGAAAGLAIVFGAI